MSQTVCCKQILVTAKSWIDTLPQKNQINIEKGQSISDLIYQNVRVIDFQTAMQSLEAAQAQLSLATCEVAVDDVYLGDFFDFHTDVWQQNKGLTQEESWYWEVCMQ